MHLDRDFPRDVAAGCTVTAETRGEVVELASGAEERNQRWSRFRRDIDASLGIRSADDLAAVVALFHEAGGRARSFRFQDWGDHRSCAPSAAITPTDQPLGAGDGSRVDFQVAKTYGAGGFAVVRPILLPRLVGFRVALDGVEALAGWSLSTLGGVLTFDTAPGAGVAVSAGFAFDIPARFNADRLAVDYRFFTDPDGLGSLPDIALREVLSVT